ncbi:MAG: hypothetical protein ACRDDW_05910 [Candidatus Rhabdochlamydia sp.]
MAIGSYLSAIRNFTVDTTSTVYTFSKDAILRGYSACSSLAVRVTQIAARAIPNAVSNAVKAHPKRSYFVAGIATSIVGSVAYNYFFNNKKDDTDPVLKMHRPQ